MLLDESQMLLEIYSDSELLLTPVDNPDCSDDIKQSIVDCRSSRQDLPDVLMQKCEQQPYLCQPSSLQNHSTSLIIAPSS